MTWSADFLLVLIVLSVLGTALPYWLWFAALKQVELSRANAFRFLTPLFGLMIGAAFFDERLIVMGIVVVQRDASRP